MKQRVNDPLPVVKIEWNGKSLAIILRTKCHADVTLLAIHQASCSRAGMTPHYSPTI